MVVSPTPSLQAEGPPLVGYPRLLIQYICSYLPYLEAVSSIRNLRTRHAAVMRDSPNTDQYVQTVPVRIQYSISLCAIVGYIHYCILLKLFPFVEKSGAAGGTTLLRLQLSRIRPFSLFGFELLLKQ
jgi:hypothetical protein